MIKVYPIRIEAEDEGHNVLFSINMEDAHCCTLHIKEPILLNNQNLEQVLTAVRSGVKMLELED